MTNNIAQALITDDPEERERLLNREALRAAVAQAITCPVTGAVLDVRNSVLAIARVPGLPDASRVMSGEAYDQRAESMARAAREIPGSELVIIDGRELYKPTLQHADYPHEEGTLYDCPACEAEHVWIPLADGECGCVACAIEAER